MEWVILIAIVVLYFELSEQIKKLAGEKTKKKELPSLISLVGSKIEVILKDLYIDGNKGILKSFDNEWLVIESFNKLSKKEINYFRISNIVTINIINS